MLPAQADQTHEEPDATSNTLTRDAEQAHNHRPESVTGTDATKN